MLHIHSLNRRWFAPVCKRLVSRRLNLQPQRAGLALPLRQVQTKFKIRQAARHRTDITRYTSRVTRYNRFPGPGQWTTRVDFPLLFGGLGSIPYAPFNILAFRINHKGRFRSMCSQRQEPNPDNEKHRVPEGF
jgi:hypothetical protein